MKRGLPEKPDSDGVGGGEGHLFLYGNDQGPAVHITEDGDRA